MSISFAVRNANFSGELGFRRRNGSGNTAGDPGEIRQFAKGNSNILELAKSRFQYLGITKCRNRDYPACKSFRCPILAKKGGRVRLTDSVSFAVASRAVWNLQPTD
jgi:hypothetical protein